MLCVARDQNYKLLLNVFEITEDNIDNIGYKLSVIWVAMSYAEFCIYFGKGFPCISFFIQIKDFSGWTD